MNPNPRPLRSYDPARLVFDLTRDGDLGIELHRGAWASPWAVVEAQLPHDALDVVALRPDASAQPLLPSAEGVVAFILQREALRACPPTTLCYTVAGRRVERRLALPGEP
jgi:hypothetical protein